MNRLATFLRALWPVLAAYLVAFVVLLVTSTALVLFVALARVRGPLEASRVADEAVRFALSAPGILAAAALSGATFLTVAAVTTRLLGQDFASGLRIGRTRATTAGTVAAVFGVVGLSVVLSSATDLTGAGNTGTMAEIASSLSRPSWIVFVLALLLVGVLPGVAEETFFRGLVQTRLAPRVGRWTAIVTTALLFGLIHLDRVQSPLAFGLGVFLGWTAERFGGIRPSILAHAVNNALFVTAACLGGASAEKTNGLRDDAIAMAIGAAVVGASVGVMRSKLAVRRT